MTILLYGLPALLYVLAWFGAWPRLARGGSGAPPIVVRGAASRAGALADEPPTPDAGGTLSRWTVFAGLAMHGVSLLAPVAEGVPRFGFAHALSAAMWLGIGILWFESLAVRVEALWLLVLPVAAAVAWLPGVFHGAPIAPDAAPLFVPHLMLGVLAYSVMTIAALHAVLMALAERSLHAPASFPSGDGATPWGAWIERLPPLLVLERLLFRLIGVGFALLTATVLTGVVFSEAAFGRPAALDHKTVFTLLAWALFATLLAGRRLRGWRGRTALRLTLGGFVLLMLAYAGTRFVLEVVLGRVAG